VTTAHRFSLWLVPEGAIADALQAVIDRLAQEHGGPSFPPHVTLLGSLTLPENEVVGRSRLLAASSAPFTIRLDGVGIGETYFQSLFAVVRPTPELLALRSAAQQAFPEAPVEPYRPHVSLLYGHPSAETKQTIVEALRGTLPESFEARALIVNATGPSVDDWRRVLRAELTPRPG
jgi:2'-5' RNA ligase